MNARLPALAEASEAAAADLVGDRLVHSDVRADNILIRPDGGVTIVDWPWAARGVGWFDALTLLVNVRLYDRAADVEGIIDEHPVFAEMDPDAATRVLAGLAGFFIEASMHDPIPAIPTLRRFQLRPGRRERSSGCASGWTPLAEPARTYFVAARSVIICFSSLTSARRISTWSSVAAALAVSFDTRSTIHEASVAVTTPISVMPPIIRPTATMRPGMVTG